MQKEESNKGRKKERKKGKRKKGKRKKRRKEERKKGRKEEKTNRGRTNCFVRQVLPVPRCKFGMLSEFSFFRRVCDGDDLYLHSFSCRVKPGHLSPIR